MNRLKDNHNNVKTMSKENSKKVEDSESSSVELKQTEKKRFILNDSLEGFISEYRKYRKYRQSGERRRLDRERRRLNRGKGGVLRIFLKDRNVFCNLSSRSGKILFSTSSGCLKVKGRRRIAIHVFNLTVKLIIQGIFKSSVRQFAFYLKTRGPKTKKTTLLKSLDKVRAFQFKSLYFPNPRSHNGCRPSKTRRK